MPRRRRVIVLAALAFSIAGVILMLLPLVPASNPLGSFYSRIVAERGVATEPDIRYGAHPRQRLDVYRPAGGGEPGPVAIFLYGGAWRGGDRSSYGFVGAALASRGIATVIPDYRVFPEAKFPDFVEDAADAYAWTARNIAARGPCPRPIVLIGHSAGAHTAALLTLDRGYLTRRGADLGGPAALVGLAGPYAFDPTTWPTTKEIFAQVADADSARPVNLVSKDAPPVLVLHGLEDRTVRLWNARTFAEGLSKAGATVAKVELPGIGHTGLLLAIAWPFRWRAPVLSTITEFIARHAGPAKRCG